MPIRGLLCKKKKKNVGKSHHNKAHETVAQRCLALPRDDIRKWQCHPLSIGFISMKDIRLRVHRVLYSSFPEFLNQARTKMFLESMQGGPKRSLCDVMRMKPKLQRQSNILFEDIRTIRHQ